MKRGELWTLRDDGYASKARPVVIVQSDSITFDSIVLCLLTTFESDFLASRVPIEPSADNGLKRKSYVMADKIVTVDKHMLGKRIGMLSNREMESVSKALTDVLDLK